MPHHAHLETYVASAILPGEKLSEVDSRFFRGGLGICLLYIAQGRPDIQESVKTLAGYMGKPPIQAMSAWKHLAAYLKGTAEYGCCYNGVSSRSRARRKHEPNLSLKNSVIPTGICEIGNDLNPGLEWYCSRGVWESRYIAIWCCNSSLGSAECELWTLLQHVAGLPFYKEGWSALVVQRLFCCQWYL